MAPKWIVKFCLFASIFALASGFFEEESEGKFLTSFYVQFKLIHSEVRIPEQRHMQRDGASLHKSDLPEMPLQDMQRHVQRWGK